MVKQCYGIKFFGEDFTERQLSPTELVVGEIGLDEIVGIAVNLSIGLGFKPSFGLIKELTMNGDVIAVQIPAHVGQENPQAIIFQCEGEDINDEDNYFFVNGQKIDFNFTPFNVNIAEIKITQA